MKNVRITVIKNMYNPELAEKYQARNKCACTVNREGMVFISNGWQRPKGLCESAWKCMEDYCMALSLGGGNFYNGWLGIENIAVVSCNDGIKPVVFLLERTEEDAENWTAGDDEK
ncbi:MAG: TIGR04076 family protein [Clostridiales bacterium]|nr:TIGR04076 family protein [Clostridiales bacterium]